VIGSPPDSRGSPRRSSLTTSLGKFKRHFWGRSLRHQQLDHEPHRLVRPAGIAHEAARAIDHPDRQAAAPAAQPISQMAAAMITDHRATLTTAMNLIA
jgi:hypothetical protein